MKNTAIEIVRKLQDNKFQTVFAGGCVRDKIMGIEPHDYDIATEATPDQVKSIFKKTIPVGENFGVVIVVENDMEFEVATFREDSKESDGRRPDSINFSSMKKDALRRDFTINGIFEDPIENKIYDFVGGKKDIEDGIIRFIGKPIDRIMEDKLRMLRAIRFSARFNFRLDFETQDRIKDLSCLIKKVSQERIGQELVRMLEDEGDFLDQLKRADLLFEILPEVNDIWFTEQDPFWHPEISVGNHTKLVLKNLSGNNIETKLAGLFHDIGKKSTSFVGDDNRIHSPNHARVGADMTRVAMKRLKFSNKQVDKVVDLVNQHMNLIEFTKMRKSKQKRFVSQEIFDDLRKLSEADAKGSHNDLSRFEDIDKRVIELKKEDLKPVPFVNGHDIIMTGIVDGKLIGKIKKKCYEKQLDGKFTNKDQAMKFVSSLFFKLSNG